MAEVKKCCCFFHVLSLQWCSILARITSYGGVCYDCYFSHLIRTSSVLLFFLFLLFLFLSLLLSDIIRLFFYTLIPGGIHLEFCGAESRLFQSLLAKSTRGFGDVCSYKTNSSHLPIWMMYGFFVGPLPGKPVASEGLGWDSLKMS